MGLKRSVTTLRGGTLGYAEIVALKVNRPPLPRKARHTGCGVSRSGRTSLNILPASASPPPPPRPPSVFHARRFLFDPLFSSSSFPVITPSPSLSSLLLFFFSPRPSPHCPPTPFIPPVCQFCARVRESARRRIHPDATGRISSSSFLQLVVASLRCFRCSVFSLVHSRTKARRRRPIVERIRARGPSLRPISSHRDPRLPVVERVGLERETRVTQARIEYNKFDESRDRRADRNYRNARTAIGDALSHFGFWLVMVFTLSYST